MASVQVLVQLKLLKVDSVTTAALMTNEGGLPGVSVDLHMTYMKVKGKHFFESKDDLGRQTWGADRDRGKDCEEGPNTRLPRM